MRQEDPLSPVLFNVVVDMLAILIAGAKEDGQVGGLIPHLVDGGVSILQYVDDTILFLEHDLEKAVNIKLILAFLNSYPDRRSIFIRVRSFVLVKQKIRNLSIDTYLVRSRVSKFQIFGNSDSLSKIAQIIELLEVKVSIY